jgi:hypothetical protein
MSEACISNDFEHINISQRDVKGYYFEVLVSKLLNKSGIDYTANPLDDIKVWKQYQGKGSDFKIPSLNIELEAKSGYAKIFKSWTLRDWITRFSYRNETRVIVVKPTLKLSDQCLDLLFYYNINIIYPDSISYLIGRGNKPLEVDSIKKYLELGEGNKKYDSESKCPQGLEPVSSKSSATFKDKVKTKLRSAFVNLLSGIEMLFSKIWNDKYGEVTLANWIPVKLRTKKKTNRTKTQKMFSCPFKIVVVCSHYPQFYLCSLLVVYDCIRKLLRVGYNEDKIYRYLKNCLFKGMWQYKNTHLIKCRCKPISFIDNEIVDRRFRTPLSIFEPCKKYKCSTMIGKRMCPYLIAIEKTSIKTKQLNLSVFMNGDECNEEEARS